MNPERSRAPQFSAVRRALVLAGGTLLFAVSCNTEPTYGPGGNVFAPGQPRYGYGSPQSNPGSPAGPNDRSASKKSETRKTPDIKRDPNDTTVDVTPPETKPDPGATPETSPGTATTPAAETPAVEKTTDPAPPGGTKPAVTREDLPYGQPVVGKKGYVYSPYAPDKGQVDVQDIPAGTKVKCPYTDKVFRVP